MKNVNEMTAEQVHFWMDKTIQAIATTKARGCTADRRKGQKLVAKYDALKEFMEECGVWNEYCESRGIDHILDGDDLYA